MAFLPEKIPSSSVCGKYKLFQCVDVFVCMCVTHTFIFKLDTGNIFDTSSWPTTINDSFNESADRKSSENIFEVMNAFGEELCDTLS